MVRWLGRAGSSRDLGGWGSLPCVGCTIERAAAPRSAPQRLVTGALPFVGRKLRLVAMAHNLIGTESERRLMKPTSMTAAASVVGRARQSGGWMYEAPELLPCRKRSGAQKPCRPLP